MTAEPLEQGLMRPPHRTAPNVAAPLRLLTSAGGSASITQGADLPADALRRRALHYVQAVVEIVEGDRSASQLLAWAAPKVYDDVVARTYFNRNQETAGRRRRSSSQVVSVKVCQPHAEIAEVAAHVRFGRRSHALAARFELVDRRWICTVLDWG
ncbi:hypothetical protein BH18ACT8_BH18ACT8_17840 [soil metagenome]